MVVGSWVCCGGHRSFRWGGSKSEKGSLEVGCSGRYSLEWWLGCDFVVVRSQWSVGCVRERFFNVLPIVLYNMFLIRCKIFGPKIGHKMIHIRYNEDTHVELYPIRAFHAMGGCWPVDTSHSLWKVGSRLLCGEVFKSFKLDAYFWNPPLDYIIFVYSYFLQNFKVIKDQ